MQSAHTPKIISRREQIPRDHVIGAAWAQQQNTRSGREIGTCVDFNVVARHLRVRSIRPIEKEWKLHSRSVSWRDRGHACWNRGGIGDLHCERRGRKTAHAVHRNGAHSIIDGERISPQRAGLGAEVYRRKREVDWIGKRRFVICFEEVILSINHRRPLDIETLPHVKLRVVRRRRDRRRGRCRPQPGYNKTSRCRPGGIHTTVDGGFTGFDTPEVRAVCEPTDHIGSTYRNCRISFLVRKTGGNHGGKS